MEIAKGFEAGLQLGSFQPDLLILDLAMPDSLEVCHSVKVDPATRHTKILILAESSQKDEVDASLAGGADDHLTRPPRAEELGQKMYNLKQSRASDSWNWVQGGVWKRLDRP
jgi:two-component system phosphate regulon response regulator PhoB